MYKAKHNLCPRPIFNLFQPSNYTYQVWQTDSVALSRGNSTTYGKHSIRYLGPKLWRNLSRKERLAILIPLNRKKLVWIIKPLKRWFSVQAAIYAIAKFPVCKITVFTVKTFVFDLLSLLMYYIYIYIYIFNLLYIYISFWFLASSI